MHGRTGHIAAMGAAGLMAITISGCVERTITITSEPSGALVYLNDREIGRTPVDVKFIHYGVYDVRLVKDGFEPLLSSGDAKAPLWDLPGPDFAAELLPMKLTSNVQWHYALEPVHNDPEALLERARQSRQQLSETEDASAESDSAGATAAKAGADETAGQASPQQR